MITIYQTNDKKWYKSKTIWVNIIAGVLMAISNTLPAFEHIFTPEVYTFVLAVINIGLRIVTTTGLTSGLTK